MASDLAAAAAVTGAGAVEGAAMLPVALFVGCN